MAQNSSPDDLTAVFDVVFPTIKHNELRRVRELGSGTYGKVYQCFSRVFGTVAVKVCRIEDQETLVGEVVRAIKYGGAHPNIVKVFGYYGDPRCGLSLVMEYMRGGSLMDVICKRKDLVYYVDHIVSWMHQISSAVAHMHKCNVLHRDLNPDNVLMNELYTTVKLCDLEEARVLAGQGEDMTSRVGSYLFMAPEVMTGPTYDGRADVFSLGMVFWMMFARRAPSFIEKYKTAVSFITAIQKGERPSELHILKVFNDVIKTCMKPNPDDRITSEQLCDFCADLVEQFPHGQHFLITVPESDKLYEPINVRGDVKESMTPLIANPLSTVAPAKLSAPESPDVAHFAPNDDPLLNSLQATLQEGTISQTPSLEPERSFVGETKEERKEQQERHFVQSSAYKSTSIECVQSYQQVREVERTAVEDRPMMLNFDSEALEARTSVDGTSPAPPSTPLTPSLARFTDFAVIEKVLSEPSVEPPSVPSTPSVEESVDVMSLSRESRREFVNQFEQPTSKPNSRIMQRIKRLEIQKQASAQRSAPQSTSTPVTEDDASVWLRSRRVPREDFVSVSDKKALFEKKGLIVRPKLP